MSCERMELAIALRAEGDLPAAEAAEVAAHTVKCSACAEFERELLASQTALKETALETVDDSVYRSMRARIMEKAAERERRWFPIWVLAPVTATALLTVAVIRTDEVRGPFPPSVPKAPPVTESRFERAAIRRAPGPRPALRTRTQDSLMLKLVSDEPDVVIYWLVD